MEVFLRGYLVLVHYNFIYITEKCICKWSEKSSKFQTRFEIFVAVTMWIGVFLVITSCFNQKMENIHLPTILITTFETTLHHNSEYHNQISKCSRLYTVVAKIHWPLYIWRPYLTSQHELFNILALPSL